jgi:hypothetical protein
MFAKAITSFHYIQMGCFVGCEARKSVMIFTLEDKKRERNKTSKFSWIFAEEKGNESSWK